MEFNYPFQSVKFTKICEGVYKAKGNSGMAYTVERTSKTEYGRAIWTLTTTQYDEPIQVPISKKYTMCERGWPMSHDDTGYFFMTINFSAAKRIASLIDRQMRV